jgi:DNA-binding CsgD family transcriptional regulator
LLNFVLELYRLAQDAPATEFPDLALSMLNAFVGFRSATWSEAELTPANKVEIFSVHLHNEPEEVRSKFSSFNRKFTRRVRMAAAQSGRASVLNDTSAYYNGRDEAPMRAYLRGYGHHRNILITDLRQWLSLYRPYGDVEFTERDRAVVDALMPHLAEALTINRALAVGGQISGRRARAPGARALVDANGKFLHCGRHFYDLLRQQWRDWSEPGIPAALLADLLRTRKARIADETVEVSAQPLGDALLLNARQVSPLARLTARELAIAQEFGAGKPYKAIARDLQLSPATVRNVVQKAYRKLDIDNKVALAKLFELERNTGR